MILENKSVPPYLEQCYQDLILALKSGNLTNVVSSIEAGAKFHCQSEQALRLATKRGYVDIVSYLLSKGANPHARKKEAILNSIMRGRLEVLKLFFDCGKVKFNSSNFLFVIDRAIFYKQYDMVEYLMEKSFFENPILIKRFMKGKEISDLRVISIYDSLRNKNILSDELPYSTFKKKYKI